MLQRSQLVCIYISELMLFRTTRLLHLELSCQRCLLDAAIVTLSKNLTLMCSTVIKYFIHQIFIRLQPFRSARCNGGSARNKTGRLSLECPHSTARISQISLHWAGKQASLFFLFTLQAGRTLMRPGKCDRYVEGWAWCYLPG